MARGAKGAAQSGVSVDISSAELSMSKILANLSDTSLAGFLETVVAHRFSERADERFAMGGDSASGKWAPLSPATIEIRKNLGYTSGAGQGEINVRTGNLREWLVNPTTMTVPDGLGVSMAWPGPEADATISDALAQAAGKKKGPERPVIAYDAADVGFILSSLTAWTLTGAAS